MSSTDLSDCAMEAPSAALMVVFPSPNIEEDINMLLHLLLEKSVK